MFKLRLRCDVSMAKPYSTGHIGAVASNFTEMRLAGAVKEQLVELACAEIRRFVPEMEAATLSQDPERKTLDDPFRTRLNYNRTRELMIDEIKAVESVGSAAVQAGISQVETYLSKLVYHAEVAAEKDRVATIKPRHLEMAVAGMDMSSDSDDEDSFSEVAQTEEFVISQGGGILTESSLLSLAKTHAKMPVTKDAVEELIETYYMVVEQLESDIRSNTQFGGNPVHFIESITKLQTLMSLGWMRAMLSKAAENARERGYKRIDVDQIVHLDPFA